MSNAAFDLRGIYRGQIVALRRLDCAPDRGTTFEIEPVAAVASRRSKRSSSRITQVNRSRSSTSHPAQRGGTGLQQRGLLGEARFRQAANSLAFVLAQKVPHEGI